jgi:hypothetical protein
VRKKYKAAIRIIKRIAAFFLCERRNHYGTTNRPADPSRGCVIRRTSETYEEAMKRHIENKDNDKGENS